MKILGYEIRRRLPEEKGAQFESVLQRLIAAREGWQDAVTPDTCEQSPTVKAIVTAEAGIGSRKRIGPVVPRPL